MELVIVLYHLAHMLWSDALPAIVMGLLTSQVKDVGCQVLKNAGKEYRRGRA